MIINGSALLRAAPIKNMIGTKEKIYGLSYGLSEVGYDLRLKQRVEFRAPDPSAILDVGAMLWMYGASYELTMEDQRSLYGSVTVIDEDGTSIERIGRTAIGSSIEEFCIPNHLWCEFRNKSTHARRFLDASLGTDGEPGWAGFLTIELVFQGNSDYILDFGTPILKAVFHEIEEQAQYQGKYQKQPDKPVEAIYE